MPFIYELQLPGRTATVQLFHRSSGEPATVPIPGIVDVNNPSFFRFELPVELGDYFCQLSGVSEPNAKPFPLRILDDGIYMADNWRAMDKLYPTSDTVVDSKKEIRVEALAAVVAGGLAGITQAAVSLPAGDRIAEVMRSMCASDEDYYSWRAEDWADYLKASKPTITGCVGWKEIMEWRAAQKQNRAEGNKPKG